MVPAVGGGGMGPPPQFVVYLLGRLTKHLLFRFSTCASFDPPCATSRKLMPQSLRGVQEVGTVDGRRHNERICLRRSLFATYGPGSGSLNDLTHR